MIPALQNFRTYHLALQFWRECQPLKLSSPSLRDQLNRASESIVLNLAEGSAKPHVRERLRYYGIALGSFRECQSILHISDQTEMMTRHDRLGACLYKLSRS